MAKRKKKIIPKEKGHEFFVSISDPSQIRLFLLETTKKALESMRLFQTIKEIRKQKIQEKTKLRKQVKDITSMIRQVKLVMPHVNLPTEEVKPVVKEKPKVKVVQPVIIEQPKPQPRTEIDRIEDELTEIENKLAGL